MGVSTGMLGQGALAGQAAGGVMSAVGSYFGAQAKQTQLNGAADIADINAGQSELAAQQELRKGNAQVASVSARAGQVKATQRTALAANGVDLGVGSAAEVLTSTDIGKENDINTITANAVRAAWGQREQSTNFKNAAIADRAGADSISPLMTASTSLLGSATGVASSWYMLNKSGALASAKGT